MPILLKLYRCFCHDLKICMWFGYYPEIIFCHFFCNLNLVIFKCTIMAGDINSLNLLVEIFVHKRLATIDFDRQLDAMVSISHPPVASRFPSCFINTLVLEYCNFAGTFWWSVGDRSATDTDEMLTYWQLIGD